MRKGFTLIELLVVIAIIAVLSVVVILTLNPAELLRQSRDSSRMADVATMKDAISHFETDVASTSPDAIGVYGTLYTENLSASTDTALYAATTTDGWGFDALSVTTVNNSSSRATDGTGWIPVDFDIISSGAPISIEPLDPTNTSTFYYAYVASSSVFKMAAKLESSRYQFNGGGDAVSTDGGMSSTTFEGGTDLAL